MKQSLFEVNKNILGQKAAKEAEVVAIAEERVKRLKVWGKHWKIRIGGQIFERRN